MNICILSGRTGRDPEVKTTPSGSKVVSFSIAIDKRGKDGQKETTWANCTAWGKTADFVQQYVKKGSAIEIVGQFQTRTYEKDGQMKTVSFFLVDKVGFQQGSAPSTEQQTQVKEEPRPEPEPTYENREQIGLPFEI